MKVLVVNFLWLTLAQAQILDIAQNICEFGPGPKELSCLVQTLQSDFQAGDLLTDVAQLKVTCSDAFFYESVLNPGHLGRLPRLEDLQLDFCKVRQIPAETFAGLSNLKRLSLNSHNSEWSSILIDLDPRSLAGLSSLLDLNLAFNNLWSLPRDLLTSVPLLKALNVSFNHILDMTDLGLTYEGQKSLEAIDLSHNFISSLRLTDLSLRSLKTLNLEYNRLKYLSDDCLNEVTNLQNLNFAHNQLAALPPQVFNKNENLLKLQLQNNSLTLLTSELFANLAQLEKLNLSHNAISAHLLSAETFAELKNLKVLDLSHNEMADLNPEIFAPLENLQILILDHNMIRKFEIQEILPNLKVLSLNENQLEKFDMKNATKLQKLDLNGNKLEKVDLTLESLQVLNLHGNELKSVPNLANLPSLQKLDLGQNYIEILEPFQVSALTGLSLSGNILTSIDNNTFSNLTSLTLLNLASNGLSNIPQGEKRQKISKTMQLFS